MEKSISATAKSASDWALSKIGCEYSQARRTADDVFDCSSLVARAFIAQGKKWRYGGEVPTSNREPYDDEFELIWPESYAEIGNKFGETAILNLAKQAGDLQFLCTDTKTNRSNRITHVAMVVSDSKIVHARSKKYGVCTNAFDHYAGKVCALTRYNPQCELRRGMKGYRTVALQNALNVFGAILSVDGDFGPKTEAAVREFQKRNDLLQTGIVDAETMKYLK